MCTFTLQVCVSVQTAAWRQEWRRMILGPFHHRCDWHLSLNMVSLLRAKPLEHSVGGIWFTCLLFIFSLLTGLVYLLLRAALQVLTEDSSHGLQCIVGFDGMSVCVRMCLHGCVCMLYIQGPARCADRRISWFARSVDLEYPGLVCLSVCVC